MFVHKNNSMKNQSKFIGVTTEYILVFSKNLEILKKKTSDWKLPKKGVKEILNIFQRLNAKGETLNDIRKEILDLYKRPKFSHLSRWNKVDEFGVYMDDNLSREGGEKSYTIINPNTGKKCKIPNRGWAKSYEELLRLQKENLIYYGENDTPPRIKSYLTVDSQSVPDNYIYLDTAIDKKEIDSLFGKRVFEYPKPKEMLENFMSMSTQENSIILDFFSGSATTAHATMQLNAKDRGNRKYICVQLPEKTNNEDFPTICEIGKERIRRAGEKIKDKSEKDLSNLDIGFKVFKLDSSNIKEWDSEYAKENITQLLFDHVDNIKSDRTESDILYELLLKHGLDLTTPIDEIEIDGKKIFNIGAGTLYICLANGVNNSIAERILEEHKILESPRVSVIFKDTGFINDIEKTNVIQTLKVAGITDVKSV